MQITVFGASGGIGSRVVDRLIASGHDVTGVVRDPAQADGLAAKGAKSVLADIRTDDVTAALTGADAVVWALGARLMVDGPGAATAIDGDAAVATIQLADKIGVRRWVQISSMMADRPESGPPLLLPFLHAKQASDDAARASSMEWTVIRPAGLTDAPGIGEVSIASTIEEHRPISRDDVADVAVACVTSALGAHRSFDLVSGGEAITSALASIS
jgi:uncharacterized protein YbjT (DUF2867 family)